MSRKQNNRIRNTFLVSLVFIAIIAIGIISVGRFQQTALASGFVIKSITEPNYRTDNPNLEAYNWRVVANIIGSERIVYTIEPEEFERYSGLATTNDFTIDMQSFDEDVSYSVIRDTTIADYEYSYVKGGKFFNREPSACPSGTTYQFVEENFIGTENVRHCLKQIRYGFKGSLEEPSVKFRAEMSLSAQNIEINREITSEDSVVLFDYQGERLAKAQWSGSLVSGDPLPKTNDIIAILQEGKTWYLIKEDSWNRYLNAESTFVNIWESEIVDDEKTNSNNLVNKLQTDINNYKSSRDSYLKQTTSIPSTQWSERSDVNNAKLIYTSNTRLSIPEIIFDIRADWIGIELLSGMPRIEDVECSLASSGEPNYVTVEVKNIGEQRGTFAFEKENCPSFEQSFSSITDRVTVEAGDTETKILELDTGALNDDVSEICSIRVYDVSDPENEDSEDIVCKLEKLQICEPNEYRSEILCVYQCNSEGTAEELKFCCENEAPVFDPVKEEFICKESNVEICGDNEDNDGDGEIDEGCATATTCPAKELAGIPVLPDFECLIKNKVLFALQIVGFLLVILAGIGSYYGQVALSRQLKFKKNNVVFIIVSSLIAILLYILLFQLWWLVLIIAVIIGAIIFVLNRGKK